VQNDFISTLWRRMSPTCCLKIRYFIVYHIVSTYDMSSNNLSTYCTTTTTSASWEPPYVPDIFPTIGPINDSLPGCSTNPVVVRCAVRKVQMMIIAQPALKERCPPRQRSRAERLKAKGGISLNSSNRGHRRATGGSLRIR
jgi:hypothetical protein